MKKLHTSLALAILSLSLLSHISFAATPVFSVVATAPPPTFILSGQTGVACYTVTNNTTLQLNGNGLLKGVPTGFTQVTSADDACATNSFNLGPGESCELKFSIDSTAIVSPTIGGPIVCQTANNPVYCSQPTNNTTFNVSTVAALPANAPVLTVSPDPVTVQIDAAPHGITITNTSTTVAANAVTAVLPAVLSSEVTETVATNCNSIPPGGTCMITFKGSATGVSVAATDYEVFGSNTPNVSPKPQMIVDATAETGCTGSFPAVIPDRKCRVLVSQNIYTTDMLSTTNNLVDVSECIVHHEGKAEALNRANCFCQKEGDAQNAVNGRKGTWRAWLSTQGLFSTAVDAIDNIAPGGDLTQAYYRVTGGVGVDASPMIASSYTALISTFMTDLTNSIDGNGFVVLTGSFSAGVVATGRTCNDYTLVDAGTTALFGDSAELGPSWTAFSLQNLCSISRIYCFEKPNP